MLPTGLFAQKAPEPSYPDLPRANESGETNVPGIYVVGELAGTPLVKLGLNAGVDLADRLAAELGSSAGGEVLDVIVVGAGAAGLGFAHRAHELGLRCEVLEASRFAQTVRDMYPGKVLFAEPVSAPNKSRMWFEECTREQLLERWESDVRELTIHEHTRVHGVTREGGSFRVKFDGGERLAKRVVLAVGKAGNPRKAGAEGEKQHASKVFHRLQDPKALNDKDILIYGGGDVALEAALALCASNRVTLVTIDERLTYPKKRNVDALEAKAREGKLVFKLSTKLTRIEADQVTFTTPSGPETISNDLVFEMIGAELPTALLRKSGVALERDWGVRRWVGLFLVSLFVYSLYALKKFPDSPYSWPFNVLIERSTYERTLLSVFDVCFAPFAWMFGQRALAEIRATAWFQQGYVYSFAYTLLMIVFGYQALIRWSKIAKNPTYQRVRYTSLVAFQLVFFLLVNVVAVQALSVQFSWRAWGLYQPWPLFFNTFHWWSSNDPSTIVYAFVGSGLLGTFVAIPWAARNHGKRFCTFVCGCGGLAETLGDRWRHLAPKGRRSRAWEFQGVVVLVAAAMVTLVTVGMYQTRADNVWGLAYSYVVDFWLVAVIPIAVYPFFGGKVWCRYWCPLAAYNGLLAKSYGRLGIKSNDKCITCGQCSRYCQVGVDVMAFARNEQTFDNANSACIQCGICIDVCPMDVLSFELKPKRKSLPVVA